jgi:DNA-binding MarR family transcriptional regulator
MSDPAPPSLQLDQFLPYRLSIASQRVSQVIATAYETLYRLKIPEWRIIAVIAENGPISQWEIGRKTVMDKVIVSRAAMALVERALLRRVPNPRDQRSHLLTLTAAGQSLYARVAPDALALEARLLEGFDATERALLPRLLRRLETAAIESEAAAGTEDR